MAKMHFTRDKLIRMNKDYNLGSNTFIEQRANLTKRLEANPLAKLEISLAGLKSFSEFKASIHGYSLSAFSEYVQANEETLSESQIEAINKMFGLINETGNYFYFTGFVEKEYDDYVRNYKKEARKTSYIELKDNFGNAMKLVSMKELNLSRSQKYIIKNNIPVIKYRYENYVPLYDLAKLSKAYDWKLTKTDLYIPIDVESIIKSAIPAYLAIDAPSYVLTPDEIDLGLVRRNPFLDSQNQSIKSFSQITADNGIKLYSRKELFLARTLKELVRVWIQRIMLCYESTAYDTSSIADYVLQSEEMRLWISRNGTYRALFNEDHSQSDLSFSEALEVARIRQTGMASIPSARLSSSSTIKAANHDANELLSKSFTIEKIEAKPNFYLKEYKTAAKQRSVSVERYYNNYISKNRLTIFESHADVIVTLTKIVKQAMLKYLLFEHSPLDITVMKNYERAASVYYARQLLADTAYDSSLDEVVKATSSYYEDLKLSKSFLRDVNDKNRFISKFSNVVKRNKPRRNIERHPIYVISVIDSIDDFRLKHDGRLPDYIVEQSDLRSAIAYKISKKAIFTLSDLEKLELEAIPLENLLGRADFGLETFELSESVFEMLSWAKSSAIYEFSYIEEAERGIAKAIDGLETESMHEIDVDLSLAENSDAFINQVDTIYAHTTMLNKFSSFDEYKENQEMLVARLKDLSKVWKEENSLDWLNNSEYLSRLNGEKIELYAD